MPDGIDAHARPGAHGPGEVVGAGPAAAPVAYVGGRAVEDDVVRGQAHVPLTQGRAGLEVQFHEAVGQVERHVETAAVG